VVTIVPTAIEMGGSEIGPGVEGVTTTDVAGDQTLAEPFDPLGRSAVGEGVWNHVALSLLLQGVIADGRRRAKPRFDVAFFKNMLFLLGMMGPDAGVIVGLELEHHGELLGIGLANPALHLGNLFAGSEQVLNVVADLVGDHVGLGELSRRMEPFLQLFIEGQIDIDPLVRWAIERPDGGAGQSAALGIDVVREQNETRFLVLQPSPGEEIGPDVLGHGQRRPDEVGLSLFLGAPGRRFLLGGARLGDLNPLQQHPGVGARKKAHRQHDQDRADTTAHRNLARRDPPPVLDVIAPAFVLPTHVSLSEVSRSRISKRDRRDSLTWKYPMNRELEFKVPELTKQGKWFGGLAALDPSYGSF